MSVKINLKRRVGDVLVTREVITSEDLEKALKVQEAEPAAIRRRIGSILCDDFGIDRHKVMKEIADFYAFREIGTQQDAISDERVESIKKMIGELPAELVDEMAHRKTVPFKIEKNVLIIAASDPTDPTITSLASQLNYKNYEIAYCRLELIDNILSRVYERKNEFLDLLDEIDYEDGNINDQEIDEAEIDAEINQSMLNSLVEGMLIESVRQGVSDIHIIPGTSNTTDIHFRLDGKLALWHTQTGVKPEALSAVVKDKTRNVDRFERDSSQDGFIQRKIDNHNLRFRVSIMPIVGQEFERKFE